MKEKGHCAYSTFFDKYAAPARSPECPNDKGTYKSVWCLYITAKVPSDQQTERLSLPGKIKDFVKYAVLYK